MRTKEFDSLQESTGEHNLAGKTGGAVTLAVGMAKVFSALPGMGRLMGYWYHFVIMFEALFILTLLETGTRVARFIFQETVQQFLPERLAGNRSVNLVLNVTLELGRMRLVGLSALFRQHRHLVADDGHRQSTAGDDRPGRRHDVPAWHMPRGAATPSAPAFRWYLPWPRSSPPASRASRVGGKSLREIEVALTMARIEPLSTQPGPIRDIRVAIWDYLEKSPWCSQASGAAAHAAALPP